MTCESERQEREQVLSGRLHVLARETPTTTGWLNPDVIRRRVVRRRRRRIGFGGSAVAVVAALIVAVSLSSGGTTRQAPVATGPGVRVGARIDGAVQLVSDSSRSEVLHGPDPRITPVVQAQQVLAIKLLRDLGSSDRNTSVSPSSLQLALGMLENGARGTTRTQIAHALQTPGLSASQQDGELASLTSELDSAARGHLTLDSANSIWQQEGFPLRGSFLAALAAYGAGVWRTNFRTSQGLDAINHWTDTNTHGRVPKLFDSLDPSTVLVLANALYLHAEWQYAFQKGETLTGRFTTASGRRVNAQFMNGAAATETAQHSAYDAAQLPYKGGRFAALVVMPTHGSLGHFVTGLTPSGLTGVVGALGKARGGIELPRFTTRTTSDLVPTLQRLGMRQAFGPAADFSGLSSQSGLNVDQVVQRVFVHVDEKGTTAAAATGVAVGTLGTADRPIVFDHPFLFLIRDTVTGAILFASEINNPTAG